MVNIRNNPSYYHSHHAIHLISFAGSIALKTQYYMNLYGILKTHRLPHLENHYQYLDNTHRFDISIVGVHFSYPNQC